MKTSLDCKILSTQTHLHNVKKLINKDFKTSSEKHILKISRTKVRKEISDIESVPFTSLS